MASKPNTPDFLSRPIGRDYPPELHEQVKRRQRCAVSVDGSDDYVNGSLKICLDSQQPRLEILIEDIHMVFPATHTSMRLVLHGDSRSSDAFIEANGKAALPHVNEGYVVCFFVLEPSSEPIITAPVSGMAPERLEQLRRIQKIEYSGKKVFVWFIVPTKTLHAFKDIKSYMEKIVNYVRDAFQAAGDKGEFWFAEKILFQRMLLLPAAQKCHGFLMLTANMPSWIHQAPSFLTTGTAAANLLKLPSLRSITWSLCSKPSSAQTKSTRPPWSLFLPPNVPEGNRAKYKIHGLEGEGLCIASSLADFVILTRAPLTAEWNGKTCKIELTVKVNQKSIPQIDGLVNAGKKGSTDGSSKDGVPRFSLQRTILAYGCELDPRSPLYFRMDAKESSDVPVDRMRERVEYIFQKFPLGRSQREAVERAIFHAVAGIHLIKGPPGNGKTRTIMVMMLILVCLNLKVLVCAGSNTAVDNLLYPFYVALNRDSKLRAWCGSYCRFRTPAYQMVTLRRAGFQGRLNPREVPVSPIEEELKDCQIESLVVKRAMEISETNPHARTLLELLDADRGRMLDSEERKALTSSYAKVVPIILSKCKVIGTTPNASGEDALRASEFAPFAMLCDEAGQCLESDSMIAMNWHSLHLVSLIGDTDQIPPTVVSTGENEWEKFLGRTLAHDLPHLVGVLLFAPWNYPSCLWCGSIFFRSSSFRPL